MVLLNGCSNAMSGTKGGGIQQIYDFSDKGSRECQYFSSSSHKGGRGLG